jgi:hypothetical protein
MDSNSDEPQPNATLPASNSGPHQSTTLMGLVRHDGWTGEKMATFLETFAVTANIREDSRLPAFA